MIRCAIVWGPIVALAAAASCSPTSQPTDVANLFHRANALYESGRFAEAEQAYIKCVRAGADGADVLYNLGNACAQQQKIGRALAAYHAARRIAPRDPDITHNIEQLSALTTGIAPQVPRSWLTEIIHSLISSFTLNEFAAVTTVLLIAAVATSLRAILADRPSRRLIAIICGLWLVTTLCAAACAGRYSQVYWNRTAFICAEDTNLRSGPSRRFEVTAHLTDGERVRTRRESGIWTEIVLATGKRGWVRKTNLARM